MVLSVRDNPQSKDIDISLYDLGLTDEQLAWLAGYVNNIVKPKWEYGLTEKSGMRDPFRAILAKPLLPKYFPGYDIYMHLDADAWVQDWSAVETYLKSAENGAALAITPEIHRAYTNNYTSSNEFHDFVVELYGGTWGQEYVKKYSYYPILNAGVLAMPKESPIWGMWAENIRVSLAMVLQRFRFDMVDGARVSRFVRGITLGPKHGLAMRLAAQDRAFAKPGRVRGDIHELVELKAQ